MINENNYIKKVCNLSVSDCHLTVALLKYLDKEIDNQKSIVTFFDRNIEENVNKLLDNKNVDLKNKDKIRCLNWKSNFRGNTKEIDDDSLEKICIVSGKEDYINRINNNIEKCYKNKDLKKIKIINCYDVSEVNKNLYEILDKHDTILNTTGELRMLDLLENGEREKYNLKKCK